MTHGREKAPSAAITDPAAGPSGWARLAFLVGLLLALVVADGGDLFDVTAFQWNRSDTPRPGWNAVLFAGSYLAGVAALAGLLLHPWPWLRRASALVAGLGAAVHIACRAVNGTGFGHHEAALVWSESSFGVDAVLFFAGDFWLPAVAALAVAAGLAAWAPRLALTRAPLWTIALVVASVWASAAITERSFGRVYQSPVPLRVPLLLARSFHRQVPYYGPREPVTLVPGTPLASHLVLVMDESVGGAWLGVNGGPDTTPFLSSEPPGVFNLGVASAISNLSSNSNVILQAGTRPDQFPDLALRSLRAPNVFAYMQRAGFRTHLIDTQNYSERLPNFMTPFDLEDIDEHVRVRRDHPGLAEFEMDFRGLQALLEGIRRDERSFSYLIKTGAHFPYEDKSAPDERPFQPTLSSGQHRGDPERTRNSYLNALRWTVDHFLEELLTGLEQTGEDVIVIYTSDHGQSFQPPKGGVRTWPHGTPVDPPVDQGLVPLLLLATGEARGEVARRLDPGLRNHASAFEIFATLLELAGYSEQEVRERHFGSLFRRDLDRSKRFFLSGNVFAAEGSFYDHPLVADACFKNPLGPEPPEPPDLPE